MRNVTITLFTLLPLGLGSVALATEDPRQMSAHEHGHGRLNIAIEGDNVAVELEVPGADIVGFEHEAKTSAQKQLVVNAKRVLSNVASVITFSESAKCSPVTQKVILEHDDDEEDHGDDKEDHSDPEEKHDDHDHESDTEKQHSEFQAEYRLSCAAPEEIELIAFPYFEKFTQAEVLSVVVLSDNGQGSFEVTREKPFIDLGS